eukprot:2265471-Prymnesium_polylepis.4
MCNRSKVRSAGAHQRQRHSGSTYVGARFGTCLPCPPGMAWSSGADCSVPGGFTPAPCGGHGDVHGRGPAVGEPEYHAFTSH